MATAGLIESNIDLSKPTLDPDTGITAPASAKSFGYDANMTTVNLPTDTVSGQLEAILSKDNPLTQRSDARVAEQMNGRGLINSTMAGQAAEAARIDTALPIAQQDAATFNTTRLTNQAEMNKAGQFGANAANTANLSATGAVDKANLLAQSGKQDLAMQGLKGEQAVALSNIENQYKTLMNSSALATGVWTTTQKSINDVLANGDLTPAQQQQWVDTLLLGMKTQFGVIGGIADMNLIGLLDFTAGNSVAQPGGNTVTAGGGAKNTVTTTPAATPGFSDAQIAAFNHELLKDQGDPVKLQSLLDQVKATPGGTAALLKEWNMTPEQAQAAIDGLKAGG